MPAGPMRKRVTFERELRTTDEGGGSALDWAEATTVWAQFVPERGAERVAAGRLAAPQAGTLRVRSSSLVRNITMAHRVTIDGVAHQIRGMGNPDQKNRFIEFTVERGVPV